MSEFYPFMMYTKRTTGIILASIALGGAAWYLNTVGLFDGISSSVLTSQFVCTEDNLTQKASLNRATLIRLKKAIVLQTQLESEIGALKIEGKTDEAQKKQETYRLLVHQIGTYRHFTAAYSACQKTISYLPETTTPPPTLEIANTSEIPAITGNHTISIPTAIPSTTAPITTRENSTMQPIMGTEVVFPSMTEPIPTTEVPSPTLPETTSINMENIPESTQSASTTEPIAAETTQTPSVTESSSDTTPPTPSAEV